MFACSSNFSFTSDIDLINEALAFFCCSALSCLKELVVISAYSLDSTNFLLASAALSLNNKYEVATPATVRAIPAQPPMKAKAVCAALPKAVAAVAPKTKALIEAVVAAAIADV